MLLFIGVTLAIQLLLVCSNHTSPPNKITTVLIHGKILMLTAIFFTNIGLWGIHKVTAAYSLLSLRYLSEIIFFFLNSALQLERFLLWMVVLAAELIFFGNSWYLLASCAVMFGLHYRDIRTRKEVKSVDC